MFIFAFAKYKIILGLTGFDSKMRWYVSMRSDDCVSLPNRSTVDYWLYSLTR